MSKCTHQPNGASVAWITTQIDSIADYVTRPSSAMTIEEMHCILTSLKQAEMAVGKVFSDLLSYLPDDGRAA